MKRKKAREFWIVPDVLNNIGYQHVSGCFKTEKAAKEWDKVNEIIHVREVVLPKKRAITTDEFCKQASKIVKSWPKSRQTTLDLPPNSPKRGRAKK